MPLALKIIAGPQFKNYARRYRFEAPQIMGATLGALILALQKTAIKKSRAELMKQVYTAPLPDSANGDPAYYLEIKQRRSGAVFKAVAKDEIKRLDAHTYVGRALVDHSADNDGYYYAMILEHGGRKINYTARPFWNITKMAMRTELHKLGPIALTYAKGKLKGESAGGTAALEVQE